ncbi:MAG: peptide chain release factor 2 [Clostridiales bacterium]|nr:peptide chain release factor 2 [Clostridiales bacterium]
MLDELELNILIKQGEEKLLEVKKYLFFKDKKEKIEELEKKTLESDFWDDRKKAEKVLKTLKMLKDKIENFEKLENEMNDLKEYSIMIKEAQNDEIIKKEILEEADKKIKIFFEELEKVEMIELLGDKESLNAIVTIHSGAGGKEACDWAQMLYRMYTKWSAKEGYEIEEVDSQEGDGVGYKSITFIIKGEYVSEILSGEMGVHRLVRISPFDSSKRRHTSFASVEVLPEVEEQTEVEIRSEDLRIDTYRASGAGGQHVNKTESAIRIVHIPTNIIVTCQAERSQIQNRERAMKILKSKLYLIQKEKEEEELRNKKGEEKDIAWGSQIRSYVFQPYQLVKDHRTNYEIGNVQSVMDGNITGFLHEYLILKKNNKI